MMCSIPDDDWKVVEARLETMPEEMRIGILSRVLTKQELVKEVKERTEIGHSYAHMQLRFINMGVSMKKQKRGENEKGKQISKDEM